MSKMRSHARRLRLEYSARLGRSVSIREVAEAIDVDRRVVMRIENNDLRGNDFETLALLGEFYTSRGLDARGIVEFVPGDEGQSEGEIKKPGRLAAIAA